MVADEVGFVHQDAQEAFNRIALIGGGKVTDDVVEDEVVMGFGKG